MNKFNFVFIFFLLITPQIQAQTDADCETQAICDNLPESFDATEDGVFAFIMPAESYGQVIAWWPYAY